MSQNSHVNSSRWPVRWCWLITAGLWVAYLVAGVARGAWGDLLLPLTGTVGSLIAWGTVRLGEAGRPNRHDFVILMWATGAVATSWAIVAAIRIVHGAWSGPAIACVIIATVVVGLGWGDVLQDRSDHTLQDET